MENNVEKKFYQVNLKTIRAETLGSFSIFIKVADNIVLYHANGERVTQRVLDKLIDNKVNIVYIQENEKEFFNEYLEQNLSEIFIDPSISTLEKTEIAHYSLTNIAQSLFVKKPELKTLQLYKSTVSKITDFILEEETAIYNFIKMSSSKFKISTHSINVGMFALGHAKTLLADNPGHNIHEIASGFFLHDIGKCFVPSEIINKTQPLTHVEWKIMKQHTIQGYKLLNRFNINNEEVKTIVMQHHERHNGKGYPFGLKGDEIHLYSKICYLADAFEVLTSYRPYRPANERNMSSFDALLKLKNEMSDDFEPHFFQQFVLLFSNVNKSNLTNGK